MFRRAAYLALAVDHNVLDIVPSPEVGDGVQLACSTVELRVGGEAARQRAPEVARANGLELRRELVGSGPASTVARIAGM